MTNDESIPKPEVRSSNKTPESQASATYQEPTPRVSPCRSVTYLGPTPCDEKVSIWSVIRRDIGGWIAFQAVRGAEEGGFGRGFGAVFVNGQEGSFWNAARGSCFARGPLDCDGSNVGVGA